VLSFSVYEGCAYVVQMVDRPGNKTLTWRYSPEYKYNHYPERAERAYRGRRKGVREFKYSRLDLVVEAGS